MKDLEKIAKGAVIILIGLAFGKLSSYIFRLVVARAGIEEYGLYSLGFGIFSGIVFLSMLGIQGGVIRYISYYKAKNNTNTINRTFVNAIKIVAFVSILIAVLMYLLAGYISVHVFHNMKLTPILRIFSIGIPFLAVAGILVSIPIALGKLKYSVYSRDFCYGLVSIVAVVVFFLLGYGVNAAIIAVVVASFAFFGLSFYYAVKLVKIRTFKSKFDFELVQFSWPIAAMGVLGWVLLYADSLMIGHFLGAREVGIYNVASPTSHLLGVLPFALIGLFLPISTTLYANRKNFSKILKTVSKWIFIVDLPVLLIMMFFSKQIIIILFGKEYISASLSLSVLSFGFFFYFLSMTNRQLFIVIKKQKTLLLIDLFVTMLVVILNYWLVPLRGIEGGAIATSISLFVSAIIIWFFSLRIMKIQSFDWVYLKIGAIGVLSMLFVFLFSMRYLANRTSIYFLVPMFVLFAVIYFYLLGLFKVFNKEDIGTIRSFFRKKRKA